MGNRERRRGNEWAEEGKREKGEERKNDDEREKPGAWKHRIAVRGEYTENTESRDEPGAPMHPNNGHQWGLHP